MIDFFEAISRQEIEKDFFYHRNNFFPILINCCRNEEHNNGSERDMYDSTNSMSPDGIIETNWNEVIDNFDDMNLKEELLRGIYGYGFERPSAIQQR